MMLHHSQHFLKISKMLKISLYSSIPLPNIMLHAVSFSVQCGSLQRTKITAKRISSSQGHTVILQRATPKPLYWVNFLLQRLHHIIYQSLRMIQWQESVSHHRRKVVYNHILDHHPLRQNILGKLLEFGSIRGNTETINMNWEMAHFIISFWRCTGPLTY